MFELRQRLYFTGDWNVQALKNVLIAPGARERVEGVRMSGRGRFPFKTMTVAANRRTGRTAVQRAGAGGVVTAQIAVQQIIAGGTGVTAA